MPILSPSVFFYILNFQQMFALVFKLKKKKKLQSGKNLSNYIHALGSTHEKTDKVYYLIKKNNGRMYSRQTTSEHAKC